MRVCLTGAGGFIASHIAKRLMAEGHYVIGADWKENEHFKAEEFCNEFKLLDLRTLENCKEAVDGCDWVFNLAADMGGMGFISSNNSVLMYNNTMISINILEAARSKNVKRVYYSSSACIYPEHIQLDPNNPGLKEDTAWPAAPQDGYGLEKLYAEEMYISYGKELGIETRIGRFHNIYGPVKMLLLRSLLASFSHVPFPRLPLAHTISLLSVLLLTTSPAPSFPVRHLVRRARKGPRCLLQKGRGGCA